MLGCIIGDVIGSYYEVLEVNAVGKNPDKKRSYDERIKVLNEESLFNTFCSYTDDSVLTVSIADAIINDKSYEDVLREYGLREIDLGLDKYGRSRFGKGFVSWLKKDSKGDSFGNGSAMRIAPVGYLYDDIESVKYEALKATIPSHNNVDAIRSASIVAEVIYLIRCGLKKEELKKYIEDNYCTLDFNLEDLQRNYKFSSKAMNSVPQALFCFLESTDFEDSIRKSISIGGDSDTIACIVGGISEAYYGIPQHLKNEVMNYIPEYFKPVIEEFYKRVNTNKLIRDMI